MFWMYSVPIEPSSKGLSYGPDMMPVSWANAVTTLRGQYCVVYRAGRAAREPPVSRGARTYTATAGAGLLRGCRSGQIPGRGRPSSSLMPSADPTPHT